MNKPQTQSNTQECEIPDATEQQNKKVKQKKTKLPLKTYVNNYLNLTFASLCYALAFHCFILPNTLVPGGLSGVATVLQYSLGFSAKWGIYILNMPLLILGIIFLSKEFAFRTVYVTTMVTLMLWVLEVINLPYFDANRLVAVLLGGILGGASIYYAFAGGGSGGGTEIVAQLVLKKNPELNIGNLLTGINFVVMTVGGFFTGSGKYELWIAVYSILYSYVCSLTLNILDRGIDQAVRFVIITEKYDEVATEISNRLYRGASSMEILDDEGQVRTDRKMLMVIVQFRQVYVVKQIVEKIDKNCFAYTSSVDGVVSRPNFNKRYSQWKQKYLNLRQP